MDELSTELNLPVAQLLALFVRLVRKLVEVYRGEALESLAEPSQDLPSETTNKEGKKDLTNDEDWDPTAQTLDQDLKEAADEKMDMLRSKQREMIDSLDVSQYVIGGDDTEWAAATKKLDSKQSKLVSVRNPESTKTKRKHGGLTVEEVSKEALGLTKKKKSSHKKT
jgi:N-acetyltransferase 10